MRRIVELLSIGVFLSCTVDNIACTVDGYSEDTLDAIVLNSRNVVQSMVASGDRLFTLSNFENRVNACIFDLSNNRLIDTVGGIDTGTCKIVHCNSASWGFHSDEKYPYLLVSQWNGERCCLVYRIIEDSGRESYSFSLIKTIYFKDVPSELLGIGYIDFFYEEDTLYSIAYGTRDPCDSIAPTHICAFDFSSFDSDSKTYLTNPKLSFKIDAIPARQDMTLRGGILYVGSGTGDNEFPAYMTVINIASQQIENRIKLSAISPEIWGEPEGLTVINNKIYMTSNKVKGVLYNPFSFIN